MTINELCKQYNRNESSIRQKFARSKARLEGHITKSPYSKTISLDDYAVRYLLEDKRNRNVHMQIQNAPEPQPDDPQPAELHSLGAEIKDTADMYSHWSDEKKKKVMAICLEEVNKRDRALHDIPDSFKTQELCLEAVKNFGMALQYVPKRFITEELCSIAVRSHGFALRYVPKHFITARLCNIAVKDNSFALCYVPDKYISGETVRTIFDDNYHHSWISARKYMDFKEISNAQRLLKYVPEVFKTRSLCLKAISKSDSNVEYIPEKYLNDEELIKRMIDSPTSRKYIPLSYWTKEKLAETLKNDKQTEYTKKYGLNGFPKECFSYQLYLEFIEQKLIDPMDIYRNDYYASILTSEEKEHIRQNDLDEHNKLEKIYDLIQRDSENIRLMPTDSSKYNVYAITAVCKNGKTLRFIPMEKRTLYMCQAAVEDDPEAMLYVPEKFRKQIIEEVRQRSDWIRYIFDDIYFSDLLI